MTDSKIESAKKPLASGVAPRDVAKNLGVSIPRPAGKIRANSATQPRSLVFGLAPTLLQSC